MEFILLFVFLLGFVCAFIFYKAPGVSLIFAAVAAIIICIMMNDSGTSSGQYDHYVNGVRVSSGTMSVFENFALFILFTTLIFGILYRGIPGIFYYCRKGEEKISLWTELTTIPVINREARLSNSLFFAILLWPLGFGLLNMICLGRPRIWFLRLLLTVVIVFVSGYYSMFLFRVLAWTLCCCWWIYDIIDILRMKSRY
jgi:hypothetical protein